MTAAPTRISVGPALVVVASTSRSIRSTSVGPYPSINSTTLTEERGTRFGRVSVITGLALPQSRCGGFDRRPDHRRSHHWRGYLGSETLHAWGMGTTGEQEAGSHPCGDGSGNHSCRRAA